MQEKVRQLDRVSHAHVGQESVSVGSSGWEVCAGPNKLSIYLHPIIRQHYRNR